MGQHSRLKRAYLYIIKESLYFRRAVLLQPLTKPGNQKAYSQVGLWVNIASLFVSMVCSCSFFRALLSYRDTTEPFCLYISMGKLVPLFFGILLLGSFLYSFLFSFTFIESGYITSYSMSTTFPITIVGKALQLYFTEHIWPIGCLTFLLSGIVSSLFIIINRTKRIKGYYTFWCIFTGCTLVQILMHITSDSSIFGVLVLGRFKM
ncbi:hypothetical protein NERG_02053 [Nematocida ausubeli]|uniref:Uncharacterized protein n=1 Tax=Nematocida ausubeli (strain ATCC PRA-371 / ERTm2) TaxID=1913371 RepID=H8ZEN2_NEMA1|nr:hypothetical protein NERG_02053 [Nematocida ausubeli]